VVLSGDSRQDSMDSGVDEEGDPVNNSASAKSPPPAVRRKKSLQRKYSVCAADAMPSPCTTPSKSLTQGLNTNVDEAADSLKRISLEGETPTQEVANTTTDSDEKVSEVLLKKSFDGSEDKNDFYG